MEMNILVDKLNRSIVYNVQVRTVPTIDKTHLEQFPHVEKTNKSIRFNILLVWSVIFIGFVAKIGK